MTPDTIISNKQRIKEYLSVNEYMLSPKSAIQVLDGFRGEVISSFLYNLSRFDELTLKQLSCLKSCNHVVKAIIIDQLFRNELEDILKTLIIAYFVLSHTDLIFLINLLHSLLIFNPDYSLNSQEKELYKHYNPILQQLMKE